MSCRSDTYLLPAEDAVQLYHNTPCHLLDYRSRLSPLLLAKNKRYDNIVDFWLRNDLEKQRALRNCGITESLITGESSDYEKLCAFLSVLPDMVGSPIAARSIGALRLLGYEGTVDLENADEIWSFCNAALAREAITPCSLLSRIGISLLCPVTDPADSLTPYDTITARTGKAAQDLSILPLFCPDKLFCRDGARLRIWVRNFSEAMGGTIRTLDALKDMLEARIDAFSAHGCLTALHTLSPFYRFSLPEKPTDPDGIFFRLMAGQSVADEEYNILHTELLRVLTQLYTKHGYVMQIALGTLRDANTLRCRRGPEDAGFDVRGLHTSIAEISQLFDLFTAGDSLPRILLSCDTPTDLAPVLSAISAFQQEKDGMPCILPAFSCFCNDGAAELEVQISSLAAHFPLGMAAAPPAEAEMPLACLRTDSFHRLLCAQLTRGTDGHAESNRHIVEAICHDTLLRFFRL